MTEIITDQYIDNNVWPEEFSSGWIAVYNDYITLDVVSCLYFDDTNPEGTVLEFYGIQKDIRMPDAYISWKNNLEYPEKIGECREIFVSRDFRRRGIGTKLCAWARSYAYNSSGIIFKAPPRMTIDAQSMYSHISNIYGEPYNDPEDFPPNIPYSYWGGYIV